MPPGGLIAPDQPWLMFFAFAIGHMLADYPLQGEFLAVQKNHRLPPGEVRTDLPKGLWFHCLTAHALIHAGCVWVISGSAVLGFAEFVLHWVIDFMKSEGLTNFHVDQLLHLLCKGVYVFILFKGMMPEGWS